MDVVAQTKTPKHKRCIPGEEIQHRLPLRVFGGTFGREIRRSILARACSAFLSFSNIVHWKDAMLCQGEKRLKSARDWILPRYNSITSRRRDCWLSIKWSNSVRRQSGVRNTKLNAVQKNTAITESWSECFQNVSIVSCANVADSVLCIGIFKLSSFDSLKGWPAIVPHQFIRSAHGYLACQRMKSRR
jgi:hypothetical protein